MTATLQEIGTVIGIVATVGGLGGFFLWLWIEQRARRVFSTHGALNGMGKRIDDSDKAAHDLEVLAERNEGRLNVIDESRQQEIQRIQGHDERLAEIARDMIEGRDKLVRSEEQLRTLFTAIEDLKREIKGNAS